MLVMMTMMVVVVVVVMTMMMTMMMITRMMTMTMTTRMTMTTLTVLAQVVLRLAQERVRVPVRPADRYLLRRLLLLWWCHVAHYVIVAAPVTRDTLRCCCRARLQRAHDIHLVIPRFNARRIISKRSAAAGRRVARC